jgi:hypothetical protein
MILILDGIELRISEITRLENAQTATTASAITIEGFTFTVTARAEQIPST